MTRDGHRKLLVRRAQLEQRLREVGDRAGDAAGINRDWHDNAGYEQAVQEMGILQAQLEDVTSQLDSALIVETAASTDRVEIGSRVWLDVDGERETYIIGGSADSDPARGVISDRSPMGTALLGRCAGDQVHVSTPSGAILSVRVVRVGA